MNRKKFVRFLRIVTISVLFVGLFAQICMLAEISGKNKEIANVNKTIKTMNAQKDNLNLCISEYKELGWISDRAREMGMRSAESSEIRVISIPFEYRTEEYRAAYSRTTEIADTK